MIVRANPPTSKTMFLSLVTFAAGAIAWFTWPEYSDYAIGSMVLGYAILLSGTLFKGM